MPTDTRVEALRSTPRHTLLQRAIEQFARWRHTGFTADELARQLRESPLSIRPRVAELRKAGVVQDSGLRRKNTSGKSAIVWVKCSD